MYFKLEAFVENPTWEMLDKCIKTHLLVISKHCGIPRAVVEELMSTASV